MSDLRSGDIVRFRTEKSLKDGVIALKINEVYLIISDMEASSVDKELDFLNLSGSLHFDIVRDDEIIEKLGVIKKDSIKSILKQFGRILASNYYESVHKPEIDEIKKSKINYGGRVFDEEEISNLIDSALDFWLTSGYFVQSFERELSNFLGVKYCSMVNSGSSANLLAFMALTSSMLGERRILRGDEVITVAATFPTTIAPIIQYGAIPVFVDITIPDYNIDCSLLEEAVSSKTKAVIIAHAMGNPFNVDKVKAFCEKYNLWLIEDNCDSLGSEYYHNGRWLFTGTFGDVATSSFYPPHHITTGEGGAVYTNDANVAKIINSLRDWGRDCWCPSGRDNTCGRRFGWKSGELPFGYDHKYIYSNFGFNLKATEMQAAVGLAQMRKLPDFIEKRRRNWMILKKGLKELEEFLILPEATENSKPSWFGFMITLRDGVRFSRDKIVHYLESEGIQTRMFFAGNIIRHPCFDDMRNSHYGYRVVGDLKNTEKVMKDSFWVGVYPGISEDMAEYMVCKIKEAIEKQK